MIPNTITSLNLLSGVFGVIASLGGHIDHAFLFMLAAAVFDFMDGLAARLLNAYSELGKQLDSLSDLVSFGVLPAIMLHSLMRTQCPCYWSYVPLILAVFTALRLAKFNIDERQHDSFIGLPAPASAIIAGSLCYYLSAVPDTVMSGYIGAHWFLPLAAIVLSALMVSEIPMFAMKFGGAGKTDSATKYKRISFLAVVLLVVASTPLLGFNWSWILLASFIAYVLINVAFFITRPRRA